MSPPTRRGAIGAWPAAAPSLPETRLAAGRTPLYARQDARAAAAQHVPDSERTERHRLRPTRYPNSSTSSPTRERGSPRPRSRSASCMPRSPHGNRCRLAVSVAEEGSSTRKDTDEAMTATVRELAQRRSGTDEILLLWRPEIDRVELFLRDVATGAGFLIEVEPSRAIDAFHHPYAYAPRRGKSRRVLRSEKTIVDG
jgi:hypothetical protein